MSITNAAAGLSALMLAAAPALAQTTPSPASSRGALLYETHCVACHSTQMHWRSNKAATDWSSLKTEVRRWQGNARLAWTDADIDEVARHLNDSIYRFARPTASRPSRGGPA